VSKKHFLLIYICLFSTLISSCTTGGDNVKRAELYLQIGNDYLDQKIYPDALTNLLQAEKLDPDNPRIMNSLGLLYFAREKYDTAVTYIKKAIAADPKFSDARSNLGRVYIAQGKYDKAIFEIKKALRDLTYNKPEKAQTNLGLAYFRQDRFRAAREQLLSALKLNKDYCPAYSYYGQTLMKLKEYENAGGVFDRAIKVCQNDPEEVHYLSGLSYYQMGKKEMALIRLKEVAKLYPSSEYAEKSRALLKVIEQDKL
jgi:type IV pilus assembly protein PilF